MKLETDVLNIIFADIQSWWEVPSIAHFCSLFRAAFNLLDFDIEDLEEALLTDGTEETSWLQELIVRLLSGCLANNEISTFNYQMFLRRLFRQKCQEHDRYNPFNTDIDFQFLPLRTKVEILQALCDFRLDAEDVLEHLKNLEADSLRVEPLGYDDNESAYWYFYGTRLYREDFTFKNNKKVKAVWQVICFTEEDWYQLARKFRKSNSKVERQLHRTLSENFLPELPRLFQEKEVLHRKRLLEWLPRRTSTRLDIKRQQVKHSEVIEESDQPQVVETKSEFFDSESEKAHTVKTRKKGKKRKETSAESDSSTETRKRKLEEKRHALEMAERRKQRELRSLNREKTKEKPVVTKEKSSLTKMPGATPVGRQTNNSLASATGQIVIQSVSNPNRKKLKTSQVFRQSAEDLQTGMYKILEAVKNHEDAWPFVEPVEEEYAPNYYTVIRRPMDLQRMEDKLDAGVYVSFGKFRQDFQLIVDNCRLYNGTDNEYTEMVDNLQQAFQRATDRYLDQISSSDEEIAVEFQESKDKSSNTTQTKRKKTETPNTTISRRKPTSIAHTADKRERSISVESPMSNKRESVETIEKSKKPTRTKAATAKQTKNVKNENVKINKQNKRNKKVQSPSPVRNRSPSRSRSRSRSVRKTSRSPSWPPSSPEHDETSTNDQKTESSDEDKHKTKGKHKHWKEVFKDKKTSEKPKDVKHKDKNIKLKETIEKLKAKSELSLSDDGIYRPKSKEDKLKEKNKTKKQIVNKAKIKKDSNKTNKSKCEYDFPEEEDTTKDSSVSSKKGVKKSVKKAPVKNVPDIEALTAATEQTLKDINKWLDDTPRFSEFSSASNSPSHFISEEADQLGAKADKDCLKIIKTDRPPLSKPKECQKDLFKRRKDPGKLIRRREVQRTIDRLQPGKSKGNLLSNIQNTNKPEELYPLGPLAKLRESKNSLVVKPDDTAPKLSLGTVLDSFGQQHNFSEVPEKIKEEDLVKDEVSNLSAKGDSVPDLKKDDEEVKSDEVIDPVPEKKEIKNENKATPNLSAWFKAFGAPKVQVIQKKKPDVEEEKKEPIEPQNQETKVPEVKPVEEIRKVTSPEPESPVGLSAPGQSATRQRRGSTGSSVSERSSFSQDLDSSPRMSIDERLGVAYPAPYPSPLHRSPASASPVMASPRQEDPQRAYPTLNGSIRVGFYQDTVSTKSSPDKSCSPRDQQHSPYQQYSEHVYTPPNTMQGSGFYSNPSYYTQNPSQSYSNTNQTHFYDTNKPLTDQYNAKIPPPQNFPPEEPIPNPETDNQTFRQQIKLPEKQTTMFPVKKRLYSDSEMIGKEPEPISDQNDSNFTNRSLEMNIITGRQLNIASPIQETPPTVQEPQSEGPPRLESPKSNYEAPQIDLQQPQNEMLNMSQVRRPMNFPSTTTNVYNLSESSYPQRQDSDERKLSNMGYLPPSTSQYQSIAEIQPQGVQISTQNTSTTEHMMRYPDSRVMSMGYRAPEGQSTEMLQMTQATRSVTSMASRMGQSVPVGVENYSRSTFSSPGGLGMDQTLSLRGNLANLTHIVDRYPADERLLSSTTYYTDKMFPKTIPTTNTMFSQPNIPMSYARDIQQAPTSLAYTRTLTELQNPALLVQAGKNPVMQQQQQQQIQQPQQLQQPAQTQQQLQQGPIVVEKKSRKRKTKQVTPPIVSAPNEVQNQGFQSYAGLKNTVSGEPSAISLKTASVVPGSAFNFGPTPSGLGLSTGLYSDKDAYSGFLEEYRPSTNYYMAAAAAAHRATPEANTDKPQNPRNHHQQPPTAPTPSFPFLSPRAPGYSSLASPFMGAHPHQAPPPPLMDPNSPLYQQYLHTAGVGVLHQGLLGPPGGYPPGYHPALSMRQPYDSMTRPSWL